MKTGLDKEIKNQLNQREIQPSAAAWQKLNQMLDEENPERTGKRKLWLPVSIAASVILIAGLFLILNKNHKNGIQAEIPQLVSTETHEETGIQAVQTVEAQPQQVAVAEAAIKSQTETQSKINEPETAEIQISEIITENKPVWKEEIKTPEIPETGTQIAFQKDSLKNQKKKPDFVDPGMLLYSVEHNQSVHQDGAKSKLVIIDFNKQK